MVNLTCMRYAVVLISLLIIFILLNGRMFFLKTTPEISAPSHPPTPFVSNTPRQQVVTPTTQIFQDKNIIVSVPVTNQPVAKTFTVAGNARVFENVVSIRIIDESTRKVLIQTTTYAHAPDVGQYGPYTESVTLPETVTNGSKLLLEVYQVSPKDGSDIDTVIIPVMYSQ